MSKWLLGIASIALIVAVIIISSWQFDDAVVRTPKTYTRVVALAPSMTETMIALGQGHRLVGVTIHCRDSQIANVATIGSFAEPNFEAIMAAKPDLVLGVPHVMAKKVLDRIAAQGILVFAHQPDSLRDIQFIVSHLASLFAVEHNGVRVNKQIDQAIILAKNILYQSIMQHRRRTALIAVSSSPLVVAGHSTFASEIIEAIGLINLASSKSAWPVWPVEKLLAEPPAFLIVTGGKEALPSFDAVFTSLGLDVIKSAISVVVPNKPIFNSPSPIIIKDIEQLADLFVVGV